MVVYFLQQRQHCPGSCLDMSALFVREPKCLMLSRNTRLIQPDVPQPRLTADRQHWQSFTGTMWKSPSANNLRAADHGYNGDSLFSAFAAVCVWSPSSPHYSAVIIKSLNVTTLPRAFSGSPFSVAFIFTVVSCTVLIESDSLKAVCSCSWIHQAGNRSISSGTPRLILKGECMDFPVNIVNSERN